MRIVGIILTYNEEIHIVRAIASLQQVCSRVVVVDSYSEDRTCVLAASQGAEVLQRVFQNQAEQFSWALSNSRITEEWVLRLDADEILEPSLITEIQERLPGIAREVSGVVFRRKHFFLGRWIRHGGRYPVRMIRLFRQGEASVEMRLMDEHIVLKRGVAVEFQGGFQDNSLHPISHFIDKHNRYATRAALEAIIFRRGSGKTARGGNRGLPASVKIKRYVRDAWIGRLPLGVSPLGYFLTRYIFQFGFLDGVEGLAYHFLQGFWYRFLVEIKIIEFGRAMRSLPKESIANDDDFTKVLYEAARLSFLPHSSGE